MRDDIQEAKSSLERACPLMELLPAGVNEDHRFAVGCFALLREVYGKLYGIRDGSERELLGIDEDGNDGIGAYGGSVDDDVDTPSDKEKDRERSDDDDDIGRRRGRRRRRKRGKMYGRGVPSLSSSSGAGPSSSHPDSDREDSYDLSLQTSFDIDRRFEDLRSPYDHLREELQLQQRQDSSQPAPQIMYKEGAGLATATADLDALVQRFVYEDNVGRLKLFRMAKDYHEAMTVHMAANPQLIHGLGRDLDIVLVYVEVLSKVNTEGGFDFISKELDHFNLAVAAPDMDERVDARFDNYPDGSLSFQDDDSDDSTQRGGDMDIDADNYEDDGDDDEVEDEYSPEFDGEGADFDGGIDGEHSDDLESSQSSGAPSILSERLGNMNLDGDRSRSRSISGAGRIKRHSGVHSSTRKSLKAQPKQQIAEALRDESARLSLVSANARRKNRIQHMLNAESSTDTARYVEPSGRSRSSPLSPAERNRFMVLNAFERALSENNNPSYDHARGERDVDSAGVIYDSGKGKRGDVSARERWANDNYEKIRETASKMFDASIAEDKSRAQIGSMAYIILTIALCVLVILLVSIAYVASQLKVDALPEAPCKTRWSKPRSNAEYLLTLLPLPRSVIAMIGSLCGIRLSKASPSCSDDGTASASNIDDSTSSSISHIKSKKDGRKGGRGDYRERDAHRFVIPSPEGVKETEARSFFSELQGVLTSIWRELSSTVSPTAMTSDHCSGTNTSSVKLRGAVGTTSTSNSSSASGAVNGSVTHITASCNRPSVTTASPSVTVIPPTKSQTPSKSVNTKKEKVSSTNKTKSNGGASATDTASKKTHTNSAHKVKTPVIPAIPVLAQTSCVQDDNSSIDSGRDSDVDVNRTKGNENTAEMHRGLTVTASVALAVPVPVVEAVDDDAGYSRYVRKGAPNANKTAAAAAAAASAAAGITNSTGHTATRTADTTAIRVGSNGNAQQSQRNSAAMSMAPIVDAATVAQQRAALLYYETLKEREKARLINASRNPHQQSTPVPVSSGPAWSSAATRVGPPSNIAGKSNATTHQYAPASKPSGTGNGTNSGMNKGPPTPHAYPSSAPKGMTYASVAQNTSSSFSGLYEHSSRSSLNSIGSNISNISNRSDVTHMAPNSATITKMDITTSNPSSNNTSCPSSPGSNSVRRVGAAGRSCSKVLRTPEIFSSDLSLPQAGQHSAYLRAREASEQLQQLQLMSDLLSLSVRPEEGTSTPTYTKDGYLNNQPQISRSLSSSFDGSRTQIQNQFAGLVGYQPDNEENRISHRECDRDREFLAADTSDTIGDMDIGTIDLSFALASDVDADASMTGDATVKADALYGLNERNAPAQHAYDYMALSQYSNTQTQHLNSSSHIHNIYLAADEGGTSAQPYAESPYTYTDYTTVLMSGDLDQTVPRSRGFSSGSQLDLSAQSQSGLSPNAPSFNPNTLNLWSGACQEISSSNPFDHDTQRPHGIGLMDTDGTLEYAGTLDYSAHIQQQLQNQFYQDSLTQQQYDGHFSPYISITQPQQIQHALTMYYPQGVDQLHQSLLSTAGLNAPVPVSTPTIQSTYAPACQSQSQSQFSTAITGSVAECLTDENSYLAS